MPGTEDHLFCFCTIESKNKSVTNVADAKIGMGVDEGHLMHMTEALLSRMFLRNCFGYKQHAENCMQRCHWCHFISDIEFVDLTEAEIGRVYDHQIPLQTDVTMTSKDYTDKTHGQAITKGLTFQFFKIALFEIATLAGVAVADLYA